MTALRPELPPMPPSCRRLPLSARGYPVPWFVEWLTPEGEPAPQGEGSPEFRIMSRDRLVQAINERRCWVCGDRILGRFSAFLIGPMCIVNRVSAEPPSHLTCADWSARACPFLSRPHAVRREAGMPEDTVDPAGIMLERNPGVTALWVSGSWSIQRDPNGGILFDIGDPARIAYYREGREATREEVIESIQTGLPSLMQYAEGHEAEVDALVAKAMTLVPA